ncbi:hypothetical protein DFH06DRAFT_1473752 [Mycena polygramma]|nr:hypothetical protein DFH06DRAFT_1473752 [Mycena polygramma]
MFSRAHEIVTQLDTYLSIAERNQPTAGKMFSRAHEIGTQLDTYPSIVNETSRLRMQCLPFAYWQPVSNWPATAPSFGVLLAPAIVKCRMDAHRDRRLLLPISPQIDQDLLRAHQDKVDERIMAIDRSLRDVAEKISSTQQELVPISERVEAEMGRLDGERNTHAVAKERRLLILRQQEGFNRHQSHTGSTPSWYLQPVGGSSRVFLGPRLDATNLYRLDKETTRLQVLRKKLEAEQRSLTREHDAIVDPITLDAFASAPVRQIPGDVLREIFVALNCAADKHNRLTSGPKGPNIVDVGQGAGPVLSRVCSQWRAVACDHALLWSSFSFPILAKNSAQWVELYLQRSNSAPLTVQIDARTHIQTRSTGEHAIALLAAHSQRLFKLQILANQHAGQVFISIPSLQPLRGNLSSLEILQIPVWPGLSDEFAIVPRLHTLRLCSSNAGLIEHAHHFDRSQICRLTLCDANGGKLVAYPNVTDFTCLETMPRQLHIPLASPSVPPPLSTAVNAWTVQFDQQYANLGRPLGAYDGWGISNVFRRFTLPALQSLDAQFRGESSELTCFLQRSRCNLTRLVLRDCNFRISALLQILELTPDLESLTGIGGHATMITDRLFDFLAVSANTPYNLARLSSLTIVGSFAFGTAALVKMLESRTGDCPLNSNGSPRLNDVFLNLPDREIQVELLERLRRLDGVTIQLECLDSTKIMYRPF